jgi:hypothetical protein
MPPHAPRRAPPRQRNAAVGVRPADLSGGCACCAVSGAFGDALAALVGGRAYQELDLLVSSCLLLGVVSHLHGSFAEFRAPLCCTAVLCHE